MYNCEICNREIFKKIRYGGYTLCSKHMHQLRKYGKFLDSNPRTQNDLNEYRIINDIAIFDLYDIHNNKIAEFIIDSDDINRIKYHKWRLSHGYVVTGNHTKTRPTTYLSHIILGLPKTDYDNKIDHIDGNPLNNRKFNLRKCTQGENTLNKTKISNNTSGYVGVDRDKRKGRTKQWCANINVNNKKYHIGSYIRVEEAVYARYVAECELFKEYRNTKDDDIKQELFNEIPLKRKQDIKLYVLKKISN